MILPQTSPFPAPSNRTPASCQPRLAHAPTSQPIIHASPPKKSEKKVNARAIHCSLCPALAVNHARIIHPLRHPFPHEYIKLLPSHFFLLLFFPSSSSSQAKWPHSKQPTITTPSPQLCLTNSSAHHSFLFPSPLLFKLLMHFGALRATASLRHTSHSLHALSRRLLYVASTLSAHSPKLFSLPHTMTRTYPTRPHTPTPFVRRTLATLLGSR